MRKTIIKISAIVLCALAVIIGCGFGITYAVLSAGAKNLPEDYSIGKNVKFIAHRGLSGEYYENSEQAFRAAADSDFFYGIEADIYFPADGVAVCAQLGRPDMNESCSRAAFDMVAANMLTGEGVGTLFK